jgi:hypothetical protein
LPLACLGAAELDRAESLAAPAALAPGSVLPPQVVGTWQGEPVTVPGPAGRVLVLEAIRSADW